MQEKGFKAGLQDALPTALGYILVRLTFGVVASASELSVSKAGLVSLLVYGGSAQFAIYATLLAHADLAPVTLTVFLVNLHNMLMSSHATTISTKTSFLNNIGIASLIIDESYGVLLGENVHNKSVAASWTYGNNLLSYAAWVLSTIVGTLLGGIIPSPESFRLNFALIGMFIGLLVLQFDAILSKDIKKLLLVLAVVAISFLICAVFLSSALAALVSTLIGCSVGVMLGERQQLCFGSHSFKVCCVLGSVSCPFYLGKMQRLTRNCHSFFEIFACFHFICFDVFRPFRR